MNKFFDTLLKFGLIAVLIVAATTKQQYNFYTFLHWTVFISSIYFVYRSRQTGILSVIFFCILLILFNPFMPFAFRKEIWCLIDFIISALIALSIDWKSLSNSLSTKGNLLFNLVKNCFWGVIVLIVSFYFVIYLIGGNPYYEYLLITGGTTTKGFVTDANESSSDSDTQGTIFSYNYTYYFVTSDGKKVNSSAQNNGRIPDEFLDLKHPYPIIVVYLKYHPEINRPKDNICETLSDFFWRRIGGGTIMLCFFLPIGFILIRKGVTNYKTERKKQHTNL